MSELPRFIASLTPPGWETRPLWSLFRRRKLTGYADEELLSVYRDYGVIPKSSRDDNHNKESDDLSGYQLVTEGSLVTNKMKAWQGSIAISRYRGIVSPAYYVYEPLSEEWDQFLHYLLRSEPYIALYGRISKGVRVNQWDLEHEALRNVPVMLPDLDTQKAIANFLDRETARIDQLIEKKKRFNELSAERFLARVSEAVGGGFGLPSTDEARQANGWRFLAIRREITLQRGVDITKDQQNEGGIYPVVSSGGVSSFHDQYLCKGPGVIIGRKGSAGKLHYEPRNYWPHDTVLYVKTFRSNIPKFVFYKFKALDLESFDRSSANPTLNRNLVHPEKVWWPSRQMQNFIVSQLDREQARLTALESRNSTSIERLREFRAALITAAVTGQIDVATWGKQGQTDCRLDQIEEAMQA